MNESRSRSSFVSSVWRVFAFVFAFAFVPAALMASTTQGRATLTFAGRSTLHEFQGHGSALPFTLTPADDGEWMADIVVEIRTLNTDNEWRDSKMRELLHAATHPNLHGRFRHIRPETVRDEKRLSFELVIGEVSRPIEAIVSNWKQGERELQFTAAFDVSLSTFGLEAPGALFLKVDDIVHVVVEVTVNQQ